MTANLTRDEARSRAESITVDSCQVELDLTGGDTTFRSVSTIAFGCTRPGSATFVNLAAASVHAITLNGTPVSADAFDGERVALDGLAERNTLTIDAECVYSRSGEGLHRFTDPADGTVYLYSDLETFDAHRVYACFDQPDLKATYQLTVRAPLDWHVVSNMAPDTDGGVPAEDGALVWHFPPTPLMSTYITHVSAGPWHIVRSEHDGIPLGIFCRRSLARYLDPEEIFEVTRQGFDFYHQAFGIKYPFGKYDQLFVPEYKAGAMENAGAVTFLEDYIFRSRVTDQAREVRGRDDLARDGAHVVRRPGDHALVGRPVAERVVRHLGGHRGAGAGHPLDELVDHVHQRVEGVGRQAGPAAVHPPDRRRHPGHRGRRGELRRHHLRQGRGGAQAARGLCRVRQLPRLAPRTSRRTRSATRRSPTCSTRSRNLGPRPRLWSREWLETTGVNTLRPVLQRRRLRAFTAFDVLQSAVPSHPTLRSHRIAIGLYSADRRRPGAHASGETDVTGDSTAGPRARRGAAAGPAAAERRRPDLRQDPA